jgi:hypothetical protein
MWAVALAVTHIDSNQLVNCRGQLSVITWSLAGR